MAELNLVGKSLGNYQILAEIGRGGMAVVYRAYQPSLNREVAIKVLPPQFTFDRQFVERFFREAQAAASLRHPHIVVIHDVAEENGLYYIVMELLQGRTLRQLVEQEGALPPARVAHVVEQIASALDYAHRRGFVHRDVKPDNIFVDDDDRVTLTDFGIAKAAWGTQLTKTGMLIGTPEYMSPEQAQGEAVGPATDIYALGIVAYQMLSGRVPFEGTTPHAILYKQVHDPPPPVGSAWLRLPPAMHSVLNAALAKEPRARYASAGQFAQALTTAIGGGVPVPTAVRPAMPVPPPPAGLAQPRARRSPWLWGLAVVAVAVLVLVAILLLRGRPSSVDVTATEQALAWLRATQTVGAMPTATLPQPTALPVETNAQPSATAASTSLPTVTVAPTSTPTPLPTAPPPTATPPPPTSTPIPPTPTCALAADPQLAPAWDRTRLGCPTAGASMIWAAWEPFERGYMLWRSDTDSVYVLNMQDGTNLFAGTWQLRAEKWDGSNPDGVGLSPPPGLHEPVRGFGWLWRTYLGGPGSQVGWAREEEKGFCANIQPFESGLVFGSSTVTYCQDEMFNWATHPSFTPLLFALYGDGTWRRH